MNISAHSKNKNDIGRLMILVGILTLVPTIIIPFYNEWKYFFAFFIPSACSILLGIIICCLFRSRHAVNSYRNLIKLGSLTVLFAWIYGIFVCAIPFLFLGDMNFLQCLFESASGWTTTGFTVIDVASTPYTFIFHRSFMQFCGGLGFILMMVMIMQNKHSVNLYNLEGHNDQLTTSVRKTARIIFYLYSGIFFIGVILYIICGMTVFDSVVHCMSALATGGFSSKPGNIADYDSVLIECVTIFIMVLGMTKFAVLLLLTKRKFKDAAKISEVRFAGIILLIIIPLIAVVLFFSFSINFAESLRHSVFNVVSIISTTGFSTVDFAILPAFVFGVLIIIMFVGGMAGSTAGGIKLNRVYLLFRGAGISINKKLFPEGRITARYYYSSYGRTEINNAMLRDVFSYAFLYFIIFLATSLALCLTANASLGSAMFEAASLSSTAGVSTGIFGTTANAATLIVGIIGMIIARLEINIIITAICSVFVKNE